MSDLFRKKSMEKVTSPEQLNDYIRVSNPGVWMVLIAVIVLLAGALAWGIFGHLDTTVQTGGICTDGKLVCYIGEADFEKVKIGGAIEVDGKEYSVSSVADTPVRLDESIDSYLLHLTGLNEDDWAYAVTAEAQDMKDGTYSASLIIERVKPLDFVLN